MITKLKIEKKTFINGKGENVEYIELSFELDGVKIKVKPIDEDKKICAYLLNRLLEEVKS